jgi:hypothetical protein
MEFMLLLWDEYDDLTGAAKHLVGNAVLELAQVTTPLATAGSLFTVLLLLPL